MFTFVAKKMGELFFWKKTACNCWEADFFLKNAEAQSSFCSALSLWACKSLRCHCTSVSVFHWQSGTGSATSERSRLPSTLSLSALVLSPVSLLEALSQCCLAQLKACADSSSSWAQSGANSGRWVFSRAKVSCLSLPELFLWGRQAVDCLSWLKKFQETNRTQLINNNMEQNSSLPPKKETKWIQVPWGIDCTWRPPWWLRSQCWEASPILWTELPVASVSPLHPQLPLFGQLALLPSEVSRSSLWACWACMVSRSLFNLRMHSCWMSWAIAFFLTWALTLFTAEQSCFEVLSSSTWCDSPNFASNFWASPWGSSFSRALR